MATKLKKITELEQKASVDLTDKIVTVAGTSVYHTSVQDLVNKAKENILTEWEAQWLDRITDGVRVFYRGTGSNSGVPYNEAISNFLTSQAEGKEAEGVFLIGTRNHLVVALEEKNNVLFSSASGLCVSPAKSDMGDAMADYNGKANTAAILAHFTSDRRDTYAPYYCNTYRKVNTSEGKGMNAGEWWMPSLGEMCDIISYWKRLNLVLSLIDGATQLGDSRNYITSTEGSASSMYRILPNKSIAGYSKTSPSGSMYYNVRPVTYYHDGQ